MRPVGFAPKRDILTTVAVVQKRTLALKLCPSVHGEIDEEQPTAVGKSSVEMQRVTAHETVV